MQEINTANEVKKETRGFQKGYLSLPLGVYNQVREAIKQECGWSNVTFYNKKDGKHTISILEIPVIEKIFSQFGINPWTGERIC